MGGTGSAPDQYAGAKAEAATAAKAAHLGTDQGTVPHTGDEGLLCKLSLHYTCWHNTFRAAWANFSYDYKNDDSSSVYTFVFV